MNQITLKSGVRTQVKYKSGSPYALSVKATGGSVTVEGTWPDGDAKAIDGSPVEAGEEVAVKTVTYNDELFLTADADTDVTFEPTFL